jgi:hypothetical protein
MAAPIHPKVAAASIAGAAVVVAVFVLGLFGVNVPPDVSASVVLLATAGGGYFKASPGA